ncbi:30s ribosomal protein s21 [Neisseria meningitidis]|nr:30s ribosomal protein s21 [Neisseria meningitidis]
MCRIRVGKGIRHLESGLLKKILNYKATEQSRARKRRLCGGFRPPFKRPADIKTS